MNSILTILRIGHGPSSSHTMGPGRAAAIFARKNPAANRFRITLCGSLAATGKGHLTDTVIIQSLEAPSLEKKVPPPHVEIIWQPDTALTAHPNGLILEAFDGKNSQASTDSWTVFSVGGGELAEWDAVQACFVRIPFDFELTKKSEEKGITEIYAERNMSQILNKLTKTGLSFWEYICEKEGNHITAQLGKLWNAMQESIQAGLVTEGVLPGELKLTRKAAQYYAKGKIITSALRTSVFLFAYALAVSEENASGGKVVTAPTCGSCGVLPSVLRAMKERFRLSDEQIISALGVAALFGLVAKTNGSISGAEVGCQGEIGVSCAMAAAAAAKLMGGTPHQIEYAAEIGLEHHLGLTCDPVAGLVQIPCIERNALAATKAVAAAQYAILSDGSHFIKYDDIISAMLQTGHDINVRYRETAQGGLAVIQR
ncbi:MAG: L-serine ammonia-lyase, iron-sulfur-dependent, subunit alpha [Planctomycetaceae bacterium]|jgi:L-serine dehydratase|nr:L-serine ammonia-lyase, iron-sulfur-dependent, subunit alpha [Planctomycetaceae bacterium]